MVGRKEQVMTVYLKGKDGRVDQVEKNVQTVSVDGQYINIEYTKPLKWGIVSGVKYYKDEMEITKIEA